MGSGPNNGHGDQSLVAVHVHGTINVYVGPPPAQGDDTTKALDHVSNVLEALTRAITSNPRPADAQWVDAEKAELPQESMPKELANTAPEDKKIDDAPMPVPGNVAPQEDTPAGFNGSVGKEQILGIAAEHEFSEQTAVKLYGSLTAPRTRKYLERRGVEFRAGDNGRFRKADLRRVVGHLDPEDSQLYGYGVKQHELLQVVAS